ncbi:MAG: oxygen-independent coproporphyrinogen III oxidase-like protein [Burkholderiales bacterium]|nr:oxygen-independent coproporphyrinogen III oxidase-like protein [Burkholderiales bacterium]MBH2015172.1 oxygen-independent coproporphyrinogen III oxidase-like protein [Burkholderiales bacterium]
MITLQRPGALTALPPLSLYVHLPWCIRKCPYCDFNSHEAGADQVSTEARYLDALRSDLESALPQIWGRRIHTVFIGGGTPSLFSPDSIDRLLADVRARLQLDPACEITMEANPGTFERDRFKAFREAGVTRLSIGVQSFDDTKLKALGRVHDRAQAIAAVEEAQRCFETFNLDLMYALPGQSLADLDADVSQALAFEPPHLSLYHLTMEPNTVFATRPPKDLPDEDAAFDMLDHLIERTRSAGLERYEVSAFARAGHHCEHNLNYWRFGDYLGIGAGAHSKISSPDRIVRQVRWREPAAYMEKAAQGLAVSNEHDIALSARPFEFMMNALRLKDGFELLRFAERTGLTLASIQKPLAEAEAKGLLQRDLARAWPTARGFDFLSDLQGLFLND